MFHLLRIYLSLILQKEYGVCAEPQPDTSIPQSKTRANILGGKRKLKLYAEKQHMNGKGEDNSVTIRS